MLKLINKIIFLLSKVFFNLKVIRSFSQEGEDLIINRIFKSNKIKYKNIFYLDIGAGHPIRYSNTLYFYHKGAKGITVDAHYENIVLHKFLRPKDISFNFLLGNSDEVVEYYKFNQPELNTTSQDRLKKLGEHKIFPSHKEKIMKKNLNDFFDKELKKDLSKINFLNIDIEGGELELIKLIDWNIFMPNIICIEIIVNNFNEIFKSEIYKIISSKDYKLFSKLYNSVIFVKDLK
tara:strand:+ start:719 stop:1420 length:702 start_codon:yes stop_codon:yes gene_type:complete